MTMELERSFKLPQIFPFGTVQREDIISCHSQSSLRQSAVTCERYQIHLLEYAWAEDVPKVRVDPIQSKMKEQKRNKQKISDQWISF